MFRSLSNAKNLGKILLGLVAIFCLLAAISGCGDKAYRAQVYDGAHVLNTSQVQRAASNMRDPMAIYTTNTFNGTQADFQNAVTQKLNGNPNMIVMGIDTAHSYTYMNKGPNVQMSNADLARANQAFAANYTPGNYTGATVAAVNSVQHSLGAPNNGSATSNPGWFGLLIPLLLALGAGLFMANRRGSAFQAARPVQGTPYRPINPNMGTGYREGERGVGGSFGETNRGAGTTFGETNRGAGTTFGETNRGVGGRFGEAERGVGGRFGEAERGAGGSYGTDLGGAGGSFGSKNIRGDGSPGSDSFPEQNDTGTRF